MRSDDALAEMAKAGQFEDMRPAPTDVGGFKRVDVINCNLFDVDNFGVLNWFVSLQGCKSCTDRQTALSIELSSQMLCSFVVEGVPQQVCSAASR